MENAVRFQLEDTVESRLWPQQPRNTPDRRKTAAKQPIDDDISSGLVLYESFFLMPCGFIKRPVRGYSHRPLSAICLDWILTERLLLEWTSLRLSLWDSFCLILIFLIHMRINQRNTTLEDTESEWETDVGPQKTKRKIGPDVYYMFSIHFCGPQRFGFESPRSRS